MLVVNAIHAFMWILRNGFFLTTLPQRPVLWRALEIVEPCTFTPVSAKEQCRLLRKTVGFLVASLTSQHLALMLRFEGQPVLLRVWVL